MDEIEFAENKLLASERLTNSEGFILITIRDNKIGGVIQNTNSVDGFALCNYAKLYAEESENEIMNK